MQGALQLTVAQPMSKTGWSIWTAWAVNVVGTFFAALERLSSLSELKRAVDNWTRNERDQAHSAPAVAQSL